MWGLTITSITQHSCEISLNIIYRGLVGRIMYNPLKLSSSLGSVELEKLREAVLGGNGRNLDDLPHMDGGLIIFLRNRFLK